MPAAARARWHLARRPGLWDRRVGAGGRFLCQWQCGAGTGLWQPGQRANMPPPSGAAPGAGKGSTAAGYRSRATAVTPAQPASTHRRQAASRAPSAHCRWLPGEVRWRWGQRAAGSSIYASAVGYRATASGGPLERNRLHRHCHRAGRHGHRRRGRRGPRLCDGAGLWRDDDGEQPAGAGRCRDRRSKWATSCPRPRRRRARSMP